MSQPALLKKLISALDRLALPYMVTGSIASSAYGSPRATHDVDIVIVIEAGQVAALVNEFASEDYAIDEIAAVEAIARNDQFQLLEFATGDKADFWVLGPSEFQRQMFDRRHRDTIAGVDTWWPAPEDLIVQKLSWAQWYESERQFKDALEVYEVNYRNLDLAHMERWTANLGIEQVWQKLKHVAEPLT